MPQGVCREYTGACESQIVPPGGLQRVLGELAGAKRASKVALGDTARPSHHPSGRQEHILSLQDSEQTHHCEMQQMVDRDT